MNNRSIGVRMKKIIIYTQRVEIVESYGERRDCADQNIPRFLEACGYLPVPIPNIVYVLDEYVEKTAPAGILLTGGNSLIKYGGNAPERDDTDRRLLEIAIEKEIPVYGFCRGMQSILDYFGCRLENVSGHVAVRHQVQGEWGIFTVNSYHNQACREVKEPLWTAAMAGDGVVEAVGCRNHKIMAAMWHPEREVPFASADIERMKNFFG